MNSKRMGTFLLFACFALMSCGNSHTAAGGGDAASSGPGAEPVFGYPVGGEPWYFVQCTFVNPSVPAGLEGSTWSVGRVAIDGARARDFIVYQDGREVDKNALKDTAGRLVFDIKVRFNWRPNSKSEMNIELVEAKTGKKEYILAALQSPAGKGYWDPAWKNYLSLVLSEEHGFERSGYPVHATVGVLANYLSSPDEIRVVRAEHKGDGIVYKEIPSQVYDVATWNDPKILAIEEKDAKTGERVVRYHPTTSFSVAFLADLKAGVTAFKSTWSAAPAAKK